MLTRSFPVPRNPLPHLTYPPRVGNCGGRSNRASASLGYQIYAQIMRLTGQNAHRLLPRHAKPVLTLDIHAHAWRFDGRGDCESASMGRRVYAQTTRWIGQNAHLKPLHHAKPVTSSADMVLLRRPLFSGVRLRPVRRSIDRKFPRFFFSSDPKPAYFCWQSICDEERDVSASEPMVR
jgi:hypothetical protein